MDSDKNQLIEKLQASANILVTVSRNPSVDQLASCIGLTLILNKLGKHATAVFSGEVPSTIEFLEPDQTLEKNTDSLRDFIIALDKSKADKLRYKVENDSVRIFITPYRTSISQADLEFSQGDFNVDMVIALGVDRQEDLDDAITAHGRILHDATVASITLSPDGSLGTINWHVPAASSLSELIVEVTRTLGQDLMDGQIATSLLTGIVAETKRFSNDKTTPLTMSVSAELMAAGANQQLVASKLEEVAPTPSASTVDEPVIEETPQELEIAPADPEAAVTKDGTLEIDHMHDEALPTSPENVDTPETATIPELDIPVIEPEDTTPELSLPESPSPDSEMAPPVNQEEPIFMPPSSDQPELPAIDDQQNVLSDSAPSLTGTQKLVTEPPQLGGMLTANSVPESFDPSTDPLSMLNSASQPPLLSRDTNAVLQQAPVTEVEEPEDATAIPDPGPTAEESLPTLPVDPPVTATLTPYEPAIVPPEPVPLPEPPALLVPPPTPLLTGFTPPPPAWVPPSPDALSFGAPPVVTAPIVPSEPELDLPLPTGPAVPPPELTDARDEVEKAINAASANEQLEPIAALNAQPLGEELHAPQSPAPAFLDTLQQTIPAAPAFVPPATTVEPWQPPTEPVPSMPSAGLADAFSPADPGLSLPSTEPFVPTVTDTTAPPPVPPPIPFRFGNSAEPPQPQV